VVESDGRFGLLRAAGESRHVKRRKEKRATLTLRQHLFCENCHLKRLQPHFATLTRLSDRPSLLHSLHGGTDPKSRSSALAASAEHEAHSQRSDSHFSVATLDFDRTPCTSATKKTPKENIIETAATTLRTLISSVMNPPD